MNALDVQLDSDAIRVRAEGYRLEVSRTAPYAQYADGDGELWSRLSLLASLDRTGAADESYAFGAPEVRANDEDLVEITLAARSAAWETKAVVLRCTAQELSLRAEVTGAGDLARVTLLGGQASMPNGACGAFWSSAAHRSVFSPAPSEPVRFVRPASESISLGVVGDASAGRLNGIFSPPPLCLALGRAAPTSPTTTPESAWLGLSVRAAVSELTFTTMRYEALDGGFRVAFDYEGHTAVTGSYTTPELVIRPATSPHAAIGAYRDDLISRGLAPSTPPEVPAWWREPIFCGWGAQCALAASAGTSGLLPEGLVGTAPGAPDLARQDLYDGFLATLSSHGVEPGTVVIDDRWQEQYGTAEPDRERWPDLRAWIAERHARGQRVLLWWKAWDPAGLPAEECVLDPGGNPVAVDAGNPRYQQRLRAIVQRLLGPDGLDADGFKVDFTQRAPSGSHLNCHTDGRRGPAAWGIAGLHLLLGTLHEAAKAAKEDALVITHTPHPSFADVCDMVRTNDILERDGRGEPVAPADQLRARVAVAHAALPQHLVDTDQWPMPDRDSWRGYLEAQGGLGVPALYYVDRMDGAREQLDAADLELVARTWARYRRRL